MYRNDDGNGAISFAPSAALSETTEVFLILQTCLTCMNVSVVSLKGACVTRKHSLKSHGEGGMSLQEVV
jgi:hypothetical protein